MHTGTAAFVSTMFMSTQTTRPRKDMRDLLHNTGKNDMVTTLNQVPKPQRSDAAAMPSRRLLHE